MNRILFCSLYLFALSSLTHAADFFGGKPAGKMGAAEVTATQMRELLDAQTPEVRTAVLGNPETLRELMRAELLRRALVAEAKAAEWEKRPGMALTMERAREQALIDSFVGEKSQPEAGYPGAKDIGAAYEANKTQFRMPAQLRLAQILLRLPEKADKSAEDKAAASVREIAAKLARGGKFADFVALHSQDDASKEKGGDIGWIAIDALTPQIRAEVAGLAPGELAKPLRTPFGWQIIKVLERKAEGIRPLTEVRDAIAKALRDARVQENRNRYLESIKARDAVTLDDKAIAEIGKK